MPISDLLAQISGGKANTKTAPALQRTTSVPAKRKPDDDLRRNDSKTLRTSASALGSVKANAPQGQYMGSARPSNTLGSKSVSSTPRVANSGPPSRPSPAPAAAAPPRAAPKKGSFAEILARGQRAQVAMGQVGKIQHKKVEKGAVKKTRDEPQPLPTPAKGRVPGDYAGTAKPGQRNGHNAAQKSPVKDAHLGLIARPGVVVSRDKSKAAAAAAAEEAAAAEKKLKKAAAATTGYTGTARPKPGNPARKKDAPRGGALLNVPRHTSSKTSRYEDDYDEELDDFIDYDDEEEEEAGGPRYDYASDGSSDMEAGLDDIDHEERRAEFIGRREDIEEERLEKTLKAAKEARKRRALEEMRARRR
ncbi:hypothetical protein EsDP_00002718 [Epichloe bromicola]|uniref:SPT2 chromatin protein n=1 Tax=Epichloe bromicola TaxID=79588 RepID=A0ABQ0CLL5_9HYPO